MRQVTHAHKVAPESCNKPSGAIFVSTEEEKIRNKLKKLQDKNPEKFYMEYVTPLDVDLTSLEHYPSIEISKNDLQ